MKKVTHSTAPGRAWDWDRSRTAVHLREASLQEPRGARCRLI